MSRNEITQAERDMLAEAHAKGFMNCKEIVRALYPDRFPDRPVRWDAAYRWIADAGVEVVYIIEDGITDVPKAERTGCWGADFPKVLAYKTAYYQQIALNDWTRNVEGAVDAGLSREDAEEMMGPRPPTPEFFVDTAWKAGGTKARDSAPARQEGRADVNDKTQEKPARVKAIDLGSPVIHKIGEDPNRGDLWAVALPAEGLPEVLETVPEEDGGDGDELVIRARPDGTGRMRWQTAGTEALDGLTVILHGVTVVLEWRRKRRRLVAVLTAEQRQAILGV